MEKIYQHDEEDIKKYRFKFNKRCSKIAFLSIILVAISTVIVTGFNNNSLADQLLDTTTKFPESFETVKDQDGEVVTKVFVVNAYVNKEQKTTSTGILYAMIGDKKEPVFCTQKDVRVYGSKYVLGRKLNDKGIIHLILNIDRVIDKKISNVDSKNQGFVRDWLRQSAIWEYLYLIGDKDNKSMGESISDYANDVTVETVILNAFEIFDQDSEDIEPLFHIDNDTLYNYFGIKNLINESVNVHKGQVPSTLDVKRKSNNISITEDEKFYRSDLISVTSNIDTTLDKFTGFAVTVADGAPKGTVLLDKDDKVIEDASNLKPGTEFRIQVPIDELTNENKNVKINVDGKFVINTAREYVAESCQDVIRIALDDEIISSSLEIQFDYTPVSENTKSGISTKLYVVGLIILLAGVGIIYANTKEARKN